MQYRAESTTCKQGSVLKKRKDCEHRCALVFIKRTSRMMFLVFALKEAIRLNSVVLVEELLITNLKLWRLFCLIVVSSKGDERIAETIEV